MVEENKLQAGSTAKIAGILGVITGVLAIFVPMCDVGSGGNTLSFLGLLQAALGMDKAGYSDSVRGSLTVDAVLVLVVIVAALVVGVMGLRGQKGNKALGAVPAVFMVIYIVYMMVQNSTGWNANADMFAWVVLVLAIALAAVQARA